MTYDFYFNIGVDILILILIATIAIARYKVFTKAHLPGRGALIPLYQDFLVFKMSGHPKRFLWIFIPPIFIVAKIIAFFEIAKKFDKNNGFALGLWFLPFIFYPILAFGNSNFNNKEKTSRKIEARVLSTILMFISIVSVLFVWGLFHPKSFIHLNKIRLEIQTPIMKSLSDSVLDFRNGSVIIDDEDFFYNDPDTISWEELKPYISMLQTGDILFVNNSKYLSSLIIPGNWKHSIVYIGNGEILDATSKGVNTGLLSDLDNLAKGSLLTEIIAFHPIFSTKQKSDFMKFLYLQIGKPYDFDYDKTDDEAYYCSELISDALSSVGINISYESESIGKIVTSPNDMVKFIKEVGIPSGKFDEIFSLKKESICNKEPCDEYEANSILINRTIYQ